MTIGLLIVIFPVLVWCNNDNIKVLIKQVFTPLSYIKNLSIQNSDLTRTPGIRNMILLKMIISLGEPSEIYCFISALFFQHLKGDALF